MTTELQKIVEELRQPRTLSQFMGAHDMALALVEERAEIASRLAALQAPPQYDRELIARMLEDYRDRPGHQWTDIAIHEQIYRLREADNREAAGVRTTRINHE